MMIVRVRVALVCTPALTYTYAWQAMTIVRVRVALVCTPALTYTYAWQANAYT